MLNLPFVSLKESNLEIENELLEAIERVVRSGRYINGPEGRLFSSKMSQLHGGRHTVGVSNGLDALKLILRSYIELGLLKPGDEVLAPANTYIASILPMAELGLKIRLITPSLSTYGLDWEEAWKAAGPLTKAVMTVHLYGTPSWDFEIAEKFRERGILIIEDNAQAIGAGITDPKTGEYHPTGTLGDAAGFSFYPTKNIGALGDAGAVTTVDENLAETVRALANYGSKTRYHNIYCGYNCRLDEIQAAVLNTKLGHLEKISARRKAIAETYNSEITNSDIIKPEIITGMNQVWHQYVVRTPERDRLKEKLERKGIETDIHYPLPLHRQECFSKFDSDRLEISREAARISEAISREILSLPIANVSADQAKIIAETINEK